MGCEEVGPDTEPRSSVPVLKQGTSTNGSKELKPAWSRRVGSSRDICAKGPSSKSASARPVLRRQGARRRRRGVPLRRPRPGARFGGPDFVIARCRSGSAFFRCARGGAIARRPWLFPPVPPVPPPDQTASGGTNGPFRHQRLRSSFGSRRYRSTIKRRARSSLPISIGRRSVTRRIHRLKRRRRVKRGDSSVRRGRAHGPRKQIGRLHGFRPLGACPRFPGSCWVSLRTAAASRSAAISRSPALRSPPLRSVSF
jgi:hypothetical protein